MNRRPFRRWVLIVFVGTLVFHSLNKLWLRPLVLEANAPWWLDTFVLSVPNTLEALIGTTWLAVAAMTARRRGVRGISRMREVTIYSVVTVLAAVYVITQELKIHDLGGRNLYDPMDVVGSVIGLAAAYGLLRTRGVFRPDEG